MKIIDVHVHAWDSEPQPQEMLAKFDECGVYGACIYSRPPKGFSNVETAACSFEERMENLKGWTEKNPDRLFPVLWIHPYEENVFEKIEKAVLDGVAAFKMICTNYYVYEEHVMQVLRAIAETGKPVFFHSGILWGEGSSSRYNRPLHWESLIDIKKLRFSMGHCSWPWHDECIAMYGKFLNGVANDENAPEMFFDLTPGTPRIYREDLLTKLFTIGYDVPDNIMFGTDATAHCYNSGNWVKDWLRIDEEIYQKLGVTEEIKAKIYGENVLRFLGKTPKTFTHLRPVTDVANIWTVKTKR